MQTADNSQTALIARRKQKILGESSSSRRSVTFRDYSIFQQQTLGNVRFIHQNVGGLVEDVPCGCPTVSVSETSVVPEIKRDVVLENSGSENTFIATYSPTGNVVWVARIGGAGYDRGNGIATDESNNIVVTGSYSSNPVYIYDASGGNFKTLEISSPGSYDTFIATYSPTGSVLWAARIGGAGGQYGIATDASNNIVVTGLYTSNPLTIYDASGDVAKILDNSGSSDIFIATYSPTGSVLWAARIGGTGSDNGYGIATDTSNNIVVTGYYTSNPVYIYDASGGNFKTLDWYGSPGSYDTFIATYSPTGNVVWAARIGGAGDECGYGIATDASNNIVVTGSYSSNPVYIYDTSGGNFKTLELSGSSNTFIATYSPTGSVLWAARIDEGSEGYGIATDANNNIVVTGSYASNPLTIYDASGEVAKILDISGSSTDTFIVTYSPTGTVLWAARIGGAGFDEGYEIATDANNNIVVIGIYSSDTVTIYDASGGNFKTLDNSGFVNTFIATYSPTGTVLWAARVGGTDRDYGRGIATDTNNNIVVTGSYYSNPLTVYYAR